jgi:hypothetical protein
MNTFFLNVYNQLLVPPIVGLGIVVFVAAAVQFFLGHREGAEKLARVAPLIVTTIWGAATAAGGGAAR